jgi:hypothetical protein
MEEVGIRVCHMLSSPITIAIKKAWRWHRLRCCMVMGVELRCFRVRLENGRFLDLTFCKKPRSKFVWLARTYELRNRGRRAMLNIGEDGWALKLEILCTSRCQLWEVCVISRYSTAKKKPETSSVVFTLGHKNVHFSREHANQHELAQPLPQQEISAEFKKAIEAEGNFTRVAIDPRVQIKSSTLMPKWVQRSKQSSCTFSTRTMMFSPGLPLI